MATRATKLATFRGFKLYEYKARQTGKLKWFWRLRAKNGEIVMESGQGYNRQTDMWEILQRAFGVDF